jgi:tRNA (guanine37-N1)-methyltransferase
MKFNIITIFPEIFAALQYGVVGRAIRQNIVGFECINPRKYSKSSYGAIDDTPYGGGPGMVMMVEPLLAAIHEVQSGLPSETPIINFDPQGKLLTQDEMQELALLPNLILLAGRYEGIDERLGRLVPMRNYSIGDYVLSGGEFAALVLIDAVTRLLPNVLGDDQSAQQDSFVNGLLDYPHYTKPSSILGMQVPEVLMTGNHKDIARWRLKQSLGRTWLYRRNLLAKRQLTNDEKMLLREFIKDFVSMSK